jgi:hypothetical protein
MVASMNLNEASIEDGRKVAQMLDEKSSSVNSALWYYYPDTSDWKLVLAMPEVNTNGPKAAYKTVQRILSKVELKSNLTLDDIAVSKPEAPLFKLIRQMLRTGPNISGIRLSNNIVNGQKIEDAYVYRIQ